MLTGEGRVDAQTAFGKTALGRRATGLGGRRGLHLLRRRRHARKARLPCAPLGAVAFPVIEGPMTVEAAMAAGAAPLERAAERVARLWSLASPDETVRR